jgi:hypothetical protein
LWVVDFIAVETDAFRDILIIVPVFRVEFGAFEDDILMVFVVDDP